MDVCIILLLLLIYIFDICIIHEHKLITDIRSGLIEGIKLAVASQYSEYKRDYRGMSVSTLDHAIY